jgi:hypothetical protein
VLLFGGHYLNIQATQTLLSRAAELGFQPHNIICIGDVVAYAGYPSQKTISLYSAAYTLLWVIAKRCQASKLMTVDMDLIKKMLVIFCCTNGSSKSKSVVNKNFDIISIILNINF